MKPLAAIFGLLGFIAVGAFLFPRQSPPPPGDPLKINTGGWTDSPYITPDGKSLYVMYTPYNFFPFFSGGKVEKWGPARAGHKDNPDGNPFGDSDIYLFERGADGRFGPPRSLAFNDSGADACGMLASDGRTFYYQKDKGSADLYLVRQKADGSWGDPESLGPKVNSPSSHETNPHISEDQNTLWFTSDRPGGGGKKGNDLWVSRRGPDGAWQAATPLGAPFNTDEDEDQIWINPQGTEAWFNRGMGIFRSKKQDGRWREPVQIEFEGGPIMAGEVSFFDSGKAMIVAIPDPATRTLRICESRLLSNGKWSKPTPLD
jgi:hypothetical protein